jgi:hypothetical protein
MHMPPPAPHAWFDEVTHRPLEQQPVQLVPPQLHAPLVQACPGAHDEQAFPDDPHVVAD